MKLRFEVKGMTCAACSARVEKVSAAVPGVQRAEVNLLAGKLTVEAESAAVAPAIEKAVRAAGYGITSAGNAAPKQPASTDDGLKEMKKRIILSAIFLVILMYFTMGHMVQLPMPHWYHSNGLMQALVQFLLTLPVVYLNRAYYQRGVKSLLHGDANMDSLIAVGSGAALVYGVGVLFLMANAVGLGDMEAVSQYAHHLYFESAAMILTLVTLGKFLETRAKGKTGDAIRQLMKLRPETATVLKDGIEQEIAVEDIAVGDVVVLRAGQSVPVDGVVLTGAASVDQSALTGESLPVEKAPGDTVAAAAVVQTGYLTIRAEKVGENTTLAQIIRLVEEAGGSKAPIARLADKIAGIFVPVVMGIAAVTFAVWMLAGKGLEFALTSGIAVLVISCPCALGLATPVAIMVGTGRGASLGILFKNASALENLHRVNTVVLDKTGTLTTGEPVVTDILSDAPDKLLRVAAALEEKSEHPFARAILNRAGAMSKPTVTDFETLPGLGVSGVIDGIRYYGGNHRLMQAQGISVPSYPALAEEGKTPLYFADETGRYLGAIAAADALKPDSASAVRTLQRMGLQVVMLTGDNEKTAKAIGKKAGITEVIADVLPADKAGAVKALQEKGRRVLMVGDGINDAPALAMADVGMAIGAGTDIAVESAQVVLMSGSLTAVAVAVKLSKATITNIRQNLFWAFFYNALGIPVAAGVLYPLWQLQLSPMLGAAAMSLSSVFVVSNALRLRLFKPKMDEETQEAIIIKEEKQMETVLKVEGMMCPHCKAAVEKACKAAEGAADAVVDLQAKQVTVTGQASVSALKKAIEDAGYQIIE